MEHKNLNKVFVPFIELLKSHHLITLPWMRTPYFYFAGGCIRDTFGNSNINDFDLYVTQESDLDNLITILKELGFVEFYRTEFSAKYRFLNSYVDISLINFYTPEDLFKTYEYTINCVALDSDYNLYYHKNFLSDLEKRTLVRVEHENEWFNSDEGILSLSYREMKFLNRGYTIDDSKIDKLDMKKINIK